MLTEVTGRGAQKEGRMVAPLFSALCQLQGSTRGGLYHLAGGRAKQNILEMHQSPLSRDSAEGATALGGSV